VRRRRERRASSDPRDRLNPNITRRAGTKFYPLRGAWEASWLRRACWSSVICRSPRSCTPPCANARAIAPAATVVTASAVARPRLISSASRVDAAIGSARHVAFRFDGVELVTPGFDFIWVPGHWAWGEFGYFLASWHVSESAGAGTVWTPGYWTWSEGVYVWRAGYWDHASDSTAASPMVSATRASATKGLLAGSRVCLKHRGQPDRRGWDHQCLQQDGCEQPDRDNVGYSGGQAD
jgi:hypothetical protein